MLLLCVWFGVLRDVTSAHIAAEPAAEEIATFSPLLKTRGISKNANNQPLETKTLSAEEC